MILLIVLLMKKIIFVYYIFNFVISKCLIYDEEFCYVCIVKWYINLFILYLSDVKIV